MAHSPGSTGRAETGAQPRIVTHKNQHRYRSGPLLKHLQVPRTHHKRYSWAVWLRPSHMLYHARMPRILFDTQSHVLSGTATLGRHSDCEISLPTQRASRQHCTVTLDEHGIVWLKDLGSANGTRVNGERIEEPTALADGDTITIADIEITFRMNDADPEDLVGTRISGFVLGEILGVTDDATVYKAKQLSLNRDVAFKIFHPHLLERDPELGALIKSCAKKLVN